MQIVVPPNELAWKKCLATPDMDGAPNDLYLKTFIHVWLQTLKDYDFNRFSLLQRLLLSLLETKVCSRRCWMWRGSSSPTATSQSTSSLPWLREACFSSSSHSSSSSLHLQTTREVDMEPQRQNMEHPPHLMEPRLPHMDTERWGDFQSMASVNLMDNCVECLAAREKTSFHQYVNVHFFSQFLMKCLIRMKVTRRAAIDRSWPTCSTPTQPLRSPSWLEEWKSWLCRLSASSPTLPPSWSSRQATIHSETKTTNRGRRGQKSRRKSTEEINEDCALQGLTNHGTWHY